MYITEEKSITWFNTTEFYSVTVCGNVCIPLNLSNALISSICITFFCLSKDFMLLTGNLNNFHTCHHQGER